MEKLIELTDTNNSDLKAFFFCAVVLVKESKDPRKYLTHLYILDDHVYGCDGISVRRARLNNEYEEGYYRVFRKESQDVIVCLVDTNDKYPDVSVIFKIDGLDPLCEANISKDFFGAHAVITHAANIPFNASVLKKASGAFEVFQNDNMVILDNKEYAIAIAPIQYQKGLPGM